MTKARWAASIFSMLVLASGCSEKADPKPLVARDELWKTESTELAGHSPSLALDGQGRPAFAYFVAKWPDDEPGDPSQSLHYAERLESGKWEETKIYDMGSPRSDPTVRLVFRDGQPRILANVDGSDPILAVRSKRGWKVGVLRSEYQGNGFPSVVDIDLTDDGTAHILWISDRGLQYGTWTEIFLEAVDRLFSTDPWKARFESSVVYAPGGIGPCLDIDKNGDAHVTFTVPETRKRIHAERVRGEWVFSSKPPEIDITGVSAAHRVYTDGNQKLHYATNPQKASAHP